MVRVNEFLPHGYQKISETGLGALPPISERNFALMDEQQAFLADDFDYGDAPAIPLYHVMHAARTSFPFELGVPPLITQAMACMVAESIQRDGHLHLHAWDLLPAAVLLVSKFPEITVSLQVGGYRKPYPSFDYKPIIALLERLFPLAVWKTLQAEEFCHDQPVHMLGLSPFQLIRLGHLDISKISSAQMALFVVFWSSLRGVRNQGIRTDCVGAGLFRGIVQFSTFSGAGQGSQFAIIEMGKPHKDRHGVRMAKVGANMNAESAISADLIGDLLHGPANVEAGSMDVPSADMWEDLTPENYFTTYEIEKNSRPLGEYAQILRCQSVRSPLPGLHRTAWGQAGESFFARDIRQQDLDPVTGFVPPDDSVGNYVRLPERSSPNAYDKYVLKENDIVFAFRGSTASIGGVGFVAEAGKTAIPGQIMCIVRPKNPHDAVWLYHYLRQPAIRQWVLKHCAGSGIMKTLTTSIVAQIPVLRPGQAEIAKIAAFHGNIAAVAWSIRQQRLTMEEQVKKIDASFEMLKGME